jgi:acetate kinase
MSKPRLNAPLHNPSNLTGIRVARKLFSENKPQFAIFARGHFTARSRIHPRVIPACVKGLSGLSCDTRVLLPAAKRGDDRARLALDAFIHRLQARLGAMLASLGDSPHAVVFTDAIGEDEPSIRAAACAPFRLSRPLTWTCKKNDVSALDTDLATETSAIRLLLIKSRQAWQIARECHALWSQMQFVLPSA